jgi:hypothetical protein
LLNERKELRKGKRKGVKKKKNSNGKRGLKRFWGGISCRFILVSSRLESEESSSTTLGNVMCDRRTKNDSKVVQAAIWETDKITLNI